LTPPLSLSSEPYALYNRPLLPLPNKLGAIAPPYIVAIFHGAALQAYWCYVENVGGGGKRYDDAEEKLKTFLFCLCIVDLGTITEFFG